MSPPIMRDAAISARCEIEHLILESIRGERPTMAKNHGLSAAPVLEINLRAVSGRDRIHSLFSFFAVRSGRARVLALICCGRARQHAGYDHRSATDEKTAARAAEVIEQLPVTRRATTGCLQGTSSRTRLADRSAGIAAANRSSDLGRNERRPAGARGRIDA